MGVGQNLVDTDALPDSLGLSEFQKQQVERFTPTTLEAAKRFELSAELVMAMIHTESSFNHEAKSNRAAVGLMQVVPSTGGVEATRHVNGPTQLPSKDSLMDPDFNIEVGTAYLSFLNSHYLGFVENPEVHTLASVAAYNWGQLAYGQMFRTHGEPTNVDDFKQMLAQHAPDETRNYIDRIEKRMPSLCSLFLRGEEATQLASASTVTSVEVAELENRYRLTAFGRFRSVLG